MTKHEMQQLGAVLGWVLLGSLTFALHLCFSHIVSCVVLHTFCTVCCNSHLKRPAESFSSISSPAARVNICYRGEMSSSGTSDSVFPSVRLSLTSLDFYKTKYHHFKCLVCWGKKTTNRIFLCRHKILAIATPNEHTFSSSRGCNDVS